MTCNLPINFAFTGTPEKIVRWGVARQSSLILFPANTRTAKDALPQFLLSLLLLLLLLQATRRYLWLLLNLKYSCISHTRARVI